MTTDVSVPDLIADAQPVSRERIMDLQDHLAAMPQLDLPLRHFYARGLYVRELYVPAGVCAVGKIHKHDQITTIMGDCTMVTPGEPPQRITGYEVFETPAGVKRAVFAHADTFITTVHTNPDDLRDPEALVEQLTVPTFEALEAGRTELLEAQP
jgi:hypothetical protein